MKSNEKEITLSQEEEREVKKQGWVTAIVVFVAMMTFSVFYHFFKNETRLVLAACGNIFIFKGILNSVNKIFEKKAEEE